MSKCTKTQKALCKDLCDICFERCFLNYKGKTKNGKLKVECWDSEMNGDIIPRYITISTNFKYWFKCDVCFHSFESRIGDITSKKQKWCSYCYNRKLCKNKCDICFNKSFANYKGKTKNDKLKVECWDYEMNGDIIPRYITYSSSFKYWFKCDICFHSFESKIGNITSKHQRWCPYCSIPTKKLCKKKDCIFCYNNSFECYEGKTKNGKFKIKCLSIKNNDNIIPRYIIKNCAKKYWFICDICTHSFHISINHITSNNPRWCPYCSFQKLCIDEKCEFCFNNSFASYEGKTIINKRKNECLNFKLNNNIKSRNIFKSSNKKYWFDCDICNNLFKIRIYHITIKTHSCWCPYCKNKTEGKFKYWFETKYSEYILKYQAKYNWCKNIDTNKHLFFDFVIEDLKLIIEIDGEQHFRQVSNWSTPDERFEFDKYKMEEAMRNDYSIVRILQEDIYYDKNEWEIKFDKILKKYEKPTVICIGCKTKYKKYLEVKDVDQVRNELKYKCDCCNISFKFMSGYKRHCKTNKHQTNLKSLELSPLTV